MSEISSDLDHQCPGLKVFKFYASWLTCTLSTVSPSPLTNTLTSDSRGCHFIFHATMAWSFPRFAKQSSVLTLSVHTGELPLRRGDVSAIIYASRSLRKSRLTLGSSKARRIYFIVSQDAVTISHSKVPHTRSPSPCNLQNKIPPPRSETILCSLSSRGTLSC